MLTQIDVVFGELVGEALALPILGVTPNESLLVREVTGLNPPQVDLFIGEYARDGGFYGGRRVGQRNVVLTIDLNPNPALGESVQGLRELLYKIFIDPQVTADHIELVLHDDAGNQRNLFGYTETFETELFGTDTIAQVSIVCPDPYITDLVQTEFLNTSGTWLSLPFTYGGTAETGIEVEAIVSTPTTALQFDNNGRRMWFNNYSFANQDVVYISSNRGNRKILKSTVSLVDGMAAAQTSISRSQLWDLLYEVGDAVSLLPYLDPKSKWMELHSVNNLLRVYGTTSANSVAGIKRFWFRPRYWGV